MVMVWVRANELPQLSAAVNVRVTMYSWSHEPANVSATSVMVTMLHVSFTSGMSKGWTASHSAV